MIINTEYYQSLIDRINGVNSCEALQELTAEALGALAKQQAAIAEQMAAIAPILALLQAPSANLGAIVTWITDFITKFLTPTVKPYYTYQAQLVALSAQLTQVVDAINSAKLKFPDCSVTIPGGS